MELVEITKEIEDLCYRIIGICMNVHTEVGPGFPEQYYQKALEIEFADGNIPFVAQSPVPMLYKDIQIGINYTGLDIGLLVNFGKTKLEYKRILPTRKMLEFRQRNPYEKRKMSQ